jgi:pyruvate dehydrogenase phosphatase regulatory subunit
VQIIENCAVQQILNQNGKVVAVGTSRGTVECQYFVNCGGFWARKIGKMSEPYVKVPLHACEHYYLHTKAIPGLDPMTPGKYMLTGDLDVTSSLSIYIICAEITFAWL